MGGGVLLNAPLLQGPQQQTGTNTTTGTQQRTSLRHTQPDKKRGQQTASHILRAV